MSYSETKEPMALNEDQVAEYLLNNPDFFIKNARQVEQMRIPHPVRGTVSLVEWQLSRQRKQIQQLEEEITLLMEQATANELLFNRLISLQNDLIQAQSLQDLLDRLQRWSKSMGLSGAAVRLFSDKWQLNAPSRFPHLAISRQSFEPMRIQRMAHSNQYLGTLNGPEILLLMPDAAHVGSVALSLLGRSGDLGMIIFSSRDSHHYQQGMGTMLLEHIALLLPILINRWIERQ
jgi:uncharacterized protein YigA (DUF484 family)